MIRRVLAEDLPYPTAASAEPSLVERLARRDEATLRDVYRQHSESLRRFARRLVGDAAAADDLVHEVFLRLPRAIGRLAPEAPLGPFLIGVAVNHARHHLRAAVRRRRAQERLAREPLAPPDVPEGEVERRQLAAALTRALDQLPLDQRVAFVLCEVEERTSAEAAALVGSNDSTMRARVFHAKRKLRQLLAAFERDARNPSSSARRVPSREVWNPPRVPGEDDTS
jgi:RNA polymerase sigma-70 factor (ECF subfamily)